MIITSELARYCEQWSNVDDPLLQQLERETYLKTLAPQMMSGKIQGHFIRFLCHFLNASKVLEIGTFTGYTTIMMSRGITENGTIDTIEINPELEWIIRKYLKLEGCESYVNLMMKDALEVVPGLTGPYDLVFIDAGKRDNTTFYEMAKPILRKGGIIVVDNVLWSGKITNQNLDSDSRIIQAFNEHAFRDSEMEVLILPVRDGITICMKK